MNKGAYLQKLIKFAVLALAALAGTGQAATKACRVPDFPQEVQCGQIARPLDPAQPDGKKIDIHYVVVPSQDRNKLHDAVFLLAGGPGQSAVQLAGYGKALFERLNRRRDLVFVDQRGTGKSAPLECPELDRTEIVLSAEETYQAAAACMRRLQKLPYGELQFFSTTIAMQDLEAVRRQEGYGRINLVGASYGTRAGLEYLRQFPQSVRRLVLDGVVPPDMRLPAADAQAALDGVFAACAAEAGCRARYPDLAHSWNKLLAGLPAAVSIAHPRTGQALKFAATPELVRGLVHKSLYAPTSMAALPYALGEAAEGRFAPLVALSGATVLPGPGGIASGMHYSVLCSEAFADPSPLPARDEFERLMNRDYSRICENWPRAAIPPEFFKIPVSPVPVLLLSGGIDPVTPTRHGAAVAQALGAHAKHLSVANAGHGLLAHGCVRDVVHRFLSAGDDAQLAALDTACVRQIPRPLAWQPLQASRVKESP